jgi:hypothetical protein
MPVVNLIQRMRRSVASAMADYIADVKVAVGG